MTETGLREIADLLGIHILSSTRRGWLTAPCPFAPFLHEGGRDKNPSFFMHIDDEGPSGFNCYSCGQKGSISALTTRLCAYREESSRKILLRVMTNEIVDSFGDYDRPTHSVEPPKALNKPIYMQLYPAAGSVRECREYLADRGIGRKTTEALELRYDPDEKRIMFPVMDTFGDLFGFSGRSILEVQWDKDYPKVRDYYGLKKDMLLLNEQNAREGLPTLVVEGLFATAHLMQERVYRLANIVATMQSHLSEYQLERLVELDEPVYFLYDLDTAGRKGLYGAERQDGSRAGGGAVDITRRHLPTFVCKYPRGISDPDYLTYDHVFQMVRRGKSVAY